MEGCLIQVCVFPNDRTAEDDVGREQEESGEEQSRVEHPVVARLAEIWSKTTDEPTIGRTTTSADCNAHQLIGSPRNGLQNLPFVRRD